LWTAFQAQVGLLAQLAKAPGADEPAIKEQYALLEKRLTEDHEKLVAAAPVDTAEVVVNTCPWCIKPLKAKVQVVAISVKG